MTTAASAAEVESLEVTRKGDLFYVHASLLLNAPRPEVFVALSQYDRFHEFSERHEKISYVDPALDGTPRVYTKAKGCILFFCRTVERYARLELQPDVLISASVEPELSDLDYGLETWTLEDLGDQTRVLYYHEAKPGFWIPPLIGIWAMRRTLRQDALNASYGVEQLAMENMENMPAVVTK